MGILYFVTDREDRHIMTAPMFTLYKVFDLHPNTVSRIEKETVKLTDKCILVFKTKEEGQRDWDVLQIRRMPEEIP